MEYKAKPYALIGISGTSFSAIFVRLSAVSPGTAAFFRCAYALPALAIIACVRRSGAALTRRDRLLSAAAGVLFALDLYSWHTAIGYIGAGLATVLTNAQVIFVAVLAWIIHGERPRAIELAILPIILGGMVLVTGLGSSAAYGSRPVLGVALGVLSAITYSGYLLLLRAASSNTARGADSLLITTAGAALTVLLLSPLDGGFSLTIHMPAHAWLLVLAVMVQAVGWLLIAAAMPRLRALEVSTLLFVQPLLTMVWGYFIFAEAISSVQIAGTALVLGGVAALTARPRVVASSD